MWSHVALYKYLRYQWFNLQLLEATSTTHLTSRICHGCVYKDIKLCTLLSCTILAVLHRPVETTSLHIELVSLFSKFSSLGSVYFFFILKSSYMFPWCVDLQILGQSFSCVITFEWKIAWNYSIIAQTSMKIFTYDL